MPFKKGNPGKLKGQKNHKSKLVEEIAGRLKCNPFEVLCHFANGDWKSLGYDAECYFKETETGAVKMGYVVSPDMRLQAAKEAAKYLYAQRRAIEISPDTEQREINDEVKELTEWYKRVRTLE